MGQYSCTGHSFPFFFLMKKKGAVYGLFDGLIIPRAMWSFKNLVSSTCSDWERWNVLPVSIAGAPGFNLMV